MAYFMQIMRPVTDLAYELCFYDDPVAFLFCIHGLGVAYMLRCCDKSLLCVTYMYCVSLWRWSGNCFLSTRKLHYKRMRSHCVSSCERATYLLHYFQSHGVGVTYVWRIDVATNLRLFLCLITGLKKLLPP